jgi:ribonuclease P protein component
VKDLIPEALFTFDKSRRLLNAHDYKAVFDDAKWKISSKEFLCLAIPNSFGSPRLGLVIAKKNVKLAVQRNRVKRVIRDNFRLNREEIPNTDIVILARRGLAELSNQELNLLLNTQWHRLKKKHQK